MGNVPGGRLAHTPTAGSYGSDFGLMLAWSRLVAGLAKEGQTTLVVCDDPWLFRQLAVLPEVNPGKSPGLWFPGLRLFLRGLLARFAVTVRVMASSVMLSGQRRTLGQAQSAILAYGHPASTADGYDAYFGGLMGDIPALARALHTDCRAGRAKALVGDGRTGSLHAFGNPLFALALVFTRWRPGPEDLAGSYGWLVRRAAARENGGGGPAMTRWQIHCQNRWLRSAYPRVVAWPWENHAWERAFCRTARTLGVRTAGYQHAVIGPHQFNFSPASNPDGLDSLPDTIICNGPAYRSQLARLGIPESRLVIGGAFRLSAPEGGHFDAEGPVYVALSAIPGVTREMMAAVGSLAEKGWRFLIKDHPMYPFAFPETGAMKRTANTVPQQAGISAVLYATGTPGLEGLFAGVPSFRLLPRHAIALDIMPDGVAAAPVTAESLEGALKTASEPQPVSFDEIMAPVDLDLWRRTLDPPPRNDF